MTTHHSPLATRHSIIIPTYNRAALLAKTLRSIVEQQSAETSFEVIVVDNGSTDGTRAVCAELGMQLPDFVYHYDKEPGLLTGRHVGTTLSKGEVISFIDDDVELNPGWIGALAELFAGNPGIAIAGGPSLPKYHSYPPEWMGHFWQPAPYGGRMCLPLSLIDIGQAPLEIDPLYIFGLNYSIRKSVLLELGGFHPDCIPAHLQQFQGDGETGLSIKAGGRKVKALFAPALFLYHQVAAERMTHAYFKKWHYYSGICHSFTDIRTKNNLYPATPGSSVSGQIFDRVRNKSAQLIQSFLGKTIARKPDELVRLQGWFNESYCEGYAFHQHAFQTDDAVRSWVLKPDYWDYTLPS